MNQALVWVGRGVCVFGVCGRAVTGPDGGYPGEEGRGLAGTGG